MNILTHVAARLALNTEQHESTKLIGHSIYCLYDVLGGRVRENEVEAIYLSESILQRLADNAHHSFSRMADLPLPNRHKMTEEHKQGLDFVHEQWRKSKRKWAEEGKPFMKDGPLVLFAQTARLLAEGLVQPRPKDFGPTNHAYWVKDGATYITPWEFMTNPLPIALV